MYPNTYRQRTNHYQSIQTQSYLDGATPHQLIQMLMDGFIARVNSAKGAIQQRDFETKSETISKAIGIIGGLRESLDFERGGEIAMNLSNLYEYMSSRLLVASTENNTDILDEMLSLMHEIKAAWDVIQ